MDTMETLAQDIERVKQKAAKRDQARRIDDLVRLIDELSGEMGSYDFVSAVRAKGYDIDACTMTLSRRNITTH